jgi:hypothetical protein
MKSQISIAVSLLVINAACSSSPSAQEATSDPDPAVELRIQTADQSAIHRNGGWPVAPWQGIHPSPHEVDAGAPGASSNEDAAVGVRGDAAGRGDDAAAEAASAAPGSDAASSAPPSMFAGLHAVGNRIVGADGGTVSLHGVNRSGSEFACVGGYGFFDGPTDAASIAAMKAWGINAVRVPINEDCWLGINGVAAAYSGTNYQQAIETYVDLLLASGIYPIVDLHWNAPGTTLATGQEPMADADHSPAFWTSAAGVFKSKGSVVLELYNEPWPDNDQDTTAAWTCWRDGGSCPSVSFTVAGMQTLVDTVRATGATNLLLLGGVEYSNALSQWAAYKPTDPLNNLAAAWHVYQGNACSDASCFDQIAAPVAAAFPIIATEIGDSSCDGAFMTTVMQWLDAHDQSYAAWSWNAWGTACSNYSLVTDYTGTPNGAYGLAYQSHLMGL